jgi:hypothetical protein
VLTPKTNDTTLAMSDEPGDACDADDDNDGITDGNELTGAACGGKITNPLLADSDGDRAIDGAECSIGTNPTLAGPTNGVAAPTLAQCGALTDTDGDKVLEARERCYFGTSPTNANSDGDACSDLREVYSINGDGAVNAIDLGLVAGAFATYPFGSPAYFYDYDVSKDGSVSAIDLGLIAGASAFVSGGC